MYTSSQQLQFSDIQRSAEAVTRAYRDGIMGSDEYATAMNMILRRIEAFDRATRDTVDLIDCDDYYDGPTCFPVVSSDAEEDYDLQQPLQIASDDLGGSSVGVELHASATFSDRVDLSSDALGTSDAAAHPVGDALCDFQPSERDDLSGVNMSRVQAETALRLGGTCVKRATLSGRKADAVTRAILVLVDRARVNGTKVPPLLHRSRRRFAPVVTDLFFQGPGDEPTPLAFRPLTADLADIRADSAALPLLELSDFANISDAISALRDRVVGYRDAVASQTLAQAWPKDFIRPDFL